MWFLRRRRFLINRPLQISLLLNSLLHVFFFVAVTAVSLFLPPMLELRHFEAHSEKTVQAANQMLYLHDYFWPAVLLVLIAIFLDSIRTSHKIAGPLLRFNQTLEEIGRGKLPPSIRIRKGDFLLDEAEVINRMLEGLRENIRAIQEAQAALRETLSQCAQVVKESCPGAMERRLEELVEQADRLEERIGAFNLAP